MSHSISVDTTQHSVDSVCVFQSNRAEIKRNFSVRLQSGQTEVKIGKLPNCLEKDSIRVEGLGNAVIFDVIYQAPPDHDDDEDTSDESIAVKEAKHKVSTLESNKKIYEHQATILDDYSKTLEAQKVDAAALGSFLDTFMKRKRELHAQLLENEEALAAARKDLRGKTYALATGKHQTKRATSVNVIVFAEHDGEAELLLTYMVTNASWNPLYDLRAKIPNVPGESSSIVLQYRASITQYTGEDWKDVNLSLSTASPLTSSEIPELTTYRIGPVAPPPRPRKSVKKSVSLTYAFRAQHESTDDDADEDMGFGLFDGPDEAPRVGKMILPRTAQAVEGVTSTNFVIDGKSTIPSDLESDQQAHKVSVAQIDMQAKVEWIAVPREQASVFLRCQVKNTSQYILLAGPSSVFMNDNFVCKSWIEYVSPQETFSTSLGVDPSVKVTYHNLQKKATASAGKLLGAKQDISAFVQRITIKNNKQTTVSPLFVKDTVPVSESSTFKVTVSEPKELGLPKERVEVAVSPGVKAHWSFKGVAVEEEATTEKKAASGSEQGGGTEEDGVVEWICSVDAGKSTDLTLAYEVVGPAGQRWARR